MSQIEAKSRRARKGILRELVHKTTHRPRAMFVSKNSVSLDERRRQEVV